MCLTNLSQLVSGDPIKRDVLLITLMRCFVDRGISMISSDDKLKVSPQSTNSVSL